MGSAESTSYAASGPQPAVQTPSLIEQQQQQQQQQQQSSPYYQTSPGQMQPTLNGPVMLRDAQSGDEKALVEKMIMNLRRASENFGRFEAPLP
jgi:hypothetical protein